MKRMSASRDYDEEEEKDIVPLINEPFKIEPIINLTNNSNSQSAILKKADTDLILHSKSETSPIIPKPTES